MISFINVVLDLDLDSEDEDQDEQKSLESSRSNSTRIKGTPPPVPMLGNDLANPSGPYQTMTLGRRTTQRSPKLSAPTLSVAPPSPKRSSHTPKSTFFN